MSEENKAERTSLPAQVAAGTLAIGLLLMVIVVVAAGYVLFKPRADGLILIGQYGPMSLMGIAAGLLGLRDTDARPFKFRPALCLAILGVVVSMATVLLFGTVSVWTGVAGSLATGGTLIAAARPMTSTPDSRSGSAEE